MAREVFERAVHPNHQEPVPAVLSNEQQHRVVHEFLNASSPYVYALHEIYEAMYHEQQIVGRDYQSALPIYLLAMSYDAMMSPSNSST
eukprot:COSAG04_NODE_14795_length_555_cov_0.578947_1_plen_87_part_10